VSAVPGADGSTVPTHIFSSPNPHGLSEEAHRHILDPGKGRAAADITGRVASSRKGEAIFVVSRRSSLILLSMLPIPKERKEGLSGPPIGWIAVKPA
jgi:hypothetical protein